MTFFQKTVYNVVKQIPKGKVLTYRDVAYYCEKPRAYRAVGNALNQNRLKNVPCHRVIRVDGFPGGYAWGTAKKIAILKKEGVFFVGKKVDSSCFCKLKFLLF